jgi:N-acetylglucosamine-6-phosphate deacetylase
MASLNPARACGDTTRGSLDTGKRADIVVLDKNFDITAVFYGGERIV